MTLAIPVGWLQLGLLFVERGKDRLVLDCVVSSCGFEGDDADGRFAVGQPLTMVLTSADAGDLGRVEAAVVQRLDGGPPISVVSDDRGQIIVLSTPDEVLFLDLQVQVGDGDRPAGDDSRRGGSRFRRRRAPG